MPNLVAVLVVCGLCAEVASAGQILDRFTERLTRYKMTPQPGAGVPGQGGITSPGVPEDLHDVRDSSGVDQRLAQYRLREPVTTSSFNEQRLVQFRINEENVLREDDRGVIEYSNDGRSLTEDDLQEIVTEHLRSEETVGYRVRKDQSRLGVADGASSMCVPESVDDTSVVRAAVILPNTSDFVTSLEAVLPVLRLAEQEVQRRQLLPAALAWQWLPRDDCCDAVHAQIGTFEAVKQNVHVFFGPVCEYSVAPVARMIKFWHTPLLTTGALTFDFSKKKRSPDSEYHLLLRAGLLSFRDMALFIIELLKMYEWQKVMLVYEKDGCRHISGKHTCKLMMETLVEFLKREGLHYGSYDLEKNAADGLPTNLRRELGYQYNSECYVLNCSTFHLSRGNMAVLLQFSDV